MSDLSELQPTILDVHTSDRNLYRRCRRHWNFTSPLRLNLRPKGEAVAALWFGTGIHFALEDFHGWCRFPSAFAAFQAYHRAHRPEELPAEHDELLQLGMEMLDYYEIIWLQRHMQEYKTLWLNGEPQVELKFSIPLEDPYPELAGPEGREIRYEGRLDRLLVDREDRIYVLDYKTAKQFDTAKLPTDPQVNAYMWAAEKYLGQPIEGVVYVQLRKEAPKEPRQLVNGEFSQNKNQLTSHALYRRALIKAFGKVPTSYVDFLNYLATQESEAGDKFVRFDVIRRSHQWALNEEIKIYQEISEMLWPELPLYPNFTKDCSWDCSFRSVCLMMEDGADVDWMLQEAFGQARESNAWQDRVVYPDGLDRHRQPIVATSDDPFADLWAGLEDGSV